MSNFWAPWETRAEIYGRVIEILVKQPVTINRVKSLYNAADGVVGQAYYKGGYVIELLENLPTNVERDVFLHEAGHIACGHVAKKDVAPPNQLEVIRQAYAMRGELFAEAQAEYRRCEQEANAWSRAAYDALRREKLIWK